MRKTQGRILLVLILILALMVAGCAATPTPAPQEAPASVQPTEAPAPEPEPTAEPMPEPTAEPTTEPMAEATAEPMAEPAGPPPLPEGATLVAEGFNGPQGVLVDGDGNVWVIDSGLGGQDEVGFFNTQAMTDTVAMGGDSAQVAMISPEGEVTVVANLPSLMMGIEAIGGGRLALLDGVLYATVGQGAGDPAWEGLPNFGGVISITDGEISMVGSTWEFERANNPDGTALFDSHPYGLTAGPDGLLYVADSGANDVVRVDPATGEVELVTVLDPLPGVFPSGTRGGEMLMDPVPTAVLFDEAGNLYVSYLSGAPFIPGTAGVKMVTPDGEVSDYAVGLTMITDLRWGPDGEMYGVQFGLFTEEGPVPGSGALVYILPGADSVPVVEGLTFATSVDFNAAGDAYVTIFGVGPPMSGAVLMFKGVAK